MARNVLFTLLIALAAFTVAGCERADYQHPLHRSNNK